MSIFQEFSSNYDNKAEVQKVPLTDIENLESEFNIYVPNEFKIFLMDFGTPWTPDILDIIVDDELDLIDVQNFWTIESIIEDKKNGWTSQISTDLIPFSSDCMGSIFGFSTMDLKEKKESVPIYFFDHDLDTVTKVAETFSEWIDQFNRIKTDDNNA
ncbi:SMI1/KNR4 family protein [Maribacter sp. IgM3_T14_3]|uniref:SMI1/KNR4 family protein n=1 Tax=Maribacter sp. IgM3_T14_3 TaxID=3415140 RepID=UPI003C6F67FC